MRMRKITDAWNSQSGFSLVEVIVALLITGFLGGGVVTALYQIGNVNSIDNAKISAVNQVENAFHYFNRDMQMAQKVEINGNGYWFRFSWTTWDSVEKISVVYLVQNGTLTRSYSVDNDTAVNSVIANYITNYSATPPNTQLTPPEKAWTVEMTASTNSKLKQATVVRKTKIIPRPGS
jgi:prepilin-type N-terminal cleavage/methylation domain-containing protein